jgi:hypothetical protein
MGNIVKATEQERADAVEALAKYDALADDDERSRFPCVWDRDGDRDKDGDRDIDRDMDRDGDRDGDIERKRNRDRNRDVCS